jgi:hypothetical protein
MFSDEHLLRIFENKVLKRIFGTKRMEIPGEWEKLYDKEIHNLYPSPNIREMN